MLKAIQSGAETKPRHTVRYFSIDPKTGLCYHSAEPGVMYTKREFFSQVNCTFIQARKKTVEPTKE
jgi:hypothetical protein